MKLSKCIIALVFIGIMGLLGACTELSDFLDCSKPTVTPTPEPTVTPTATPIPNHIILTGFDQAIIQNGEIDQGYFYGEGVNWFVQWEVPTLPSGFIEFSARGFRQDEHYTGKNSLLSMWSGRDGYNYDTDPFICEVRHYGYYEDRPDVSHSIAIKMKSQGNWEERTPYRVLSWHSDTTYRFRVEWSNGQMNVYRDGIIISTSVYREPFGPVEHLIRLGANPRPRSAPESLVISDVVIGEIP